MPHQKLYVVCLSIITCDKTGHESKSVIGVFDSEQKANDYKKHYADVNCLQNVQHSISINAIILNAWS